MGVCVEGGGVVLWAGGRCGEMVRYEVLSVLSFFGERRNWRVVIGWMVGDGDWLEWLYRCFGLHFLKMEKVVCGFF